MKFTETTIAGVFVIEPNVFEDSRGYFFESYNERAFKEAGIPGLFVQDNQSKSEYGVIRGLHCQDGVHEQAKLVRVLSGKVLDVAVDIRAGSLTFGKYVAVELSEENRRQLFIPRGFLHGFSVLSDSAIFSYKCDNFYCNSAEKGVRYDDSDLSIDWKIPQSAIKISDKDSAWGSMRNLKNNLEMKGS